MEAIKIFPNPAKDELNIITSNTLSSEIEILNVMGAVLIKTKNKTKIDISSLNAGVYFLNVKQGENIYNYKFVKE